MKNLALFLLCLSFTMYGFSQRILKDEISLFYNTDSHSLNSEQKNKVNSFIEHYDDAKINKIVVFSSADFKGNNNYNLDLSKKRASKVVNYIKENTDFRVQMKYLGEKKKPKNYNTKDGVVSHRKTNIICEYILPLSKKNKPKYYQSLKRNYLNKLNYIEKNKSIRLKNINFFYGKTKTTYNSKIELKNLLEVMNKNKKLVILLEGHVCCGKSKNKEYENSLYKLNTLSTKRAQKIHDYLISNGIDSTRVSFKGYEFSKPIYFPERNERHRSLNRRVEIKVLDN